MMQNELIKKNEQPKITIVLVLVESIHKIHNETSFIV